MYLRLTSNSQYYIYTFYISTLRIWTKGLQRIFEQTAASDYKAMLPHTTVSPITLNNIDKPAACNKIERKIFTFLEDILISAEDPRVTH